MRPRVCLLHNSPQTQPIRILQHSVSDVQNSMAISVWYYCWTNLNVEIPAKCTMLHQLLYDYENFVTLSVRHVPVFCPDGWRYDHAVFSIRYDNHSCTDEPQHKTVGTRQTMIIVGSQHPQRSLVARRKTPGRAGLGPRMTSPRPYRYRPMSLMQMQNKSVSSSAKYQFIAIQRWTEDAQALR